MCSLQPNLDTQKKQLEAWRKLVLDYCRYKKIYLLNVQEAAKFLFQNKNIDSELQFQISKILH